MCGIAGIWSKTSRPASVSDVQHMLDKMVHRGPDAQGVWTSDRLVLGNRRLKILDLSDDGNQPFTDGTDVLVFNGRIFNHKEIRAELEKTYAFKSTCDTEVLFRALQAWGTEALQKVYGQFAFAFYSKVGNTLLLARDHVGICPLYVMETEEHLYFSSEIHPLLKFHSGRLDPDATLDYFTYRYNIQNGKTLFKGIQRFHPAHFCLIHLNTQTKRDERYWNLSFKTQKINMEQAQAQLDTLLDAEIARQQNTDVPVGIYLSGGIDSGALLQGYSRSSSSIQSFTLQMQEQDPDVARVEELSKKLGLKKNIAVFSDSYFDQLETVIEDLEEPFGDLIVCANHLLAKTASRDVTVVLSGEGGDESFLGYDHQRAFLKLLPLHGRGLLRKLTSAALRMMPAWLFARIQSYPGYFSTDEMKKVRKVVGKMSDASDAYIELISLFPRDELPSLFSANFWKQTSGSPDVQTISESFAKDEELWRSVFRVEVEQLTLIVNLLKQERLGMHFSLESCVPFASKPVLEFVASLPKELLYRKINKELILNYSHQPRIKKMPFSFFHNKQHLAKLIQLMDKHVNTERVEAEGILSVSEVRRIRDSLETGSILAVKKAMAILVFCVWYRRFSLRYQ